VASAPVSASPSASPVFEYFNKLRGGMEYSQAHYSRTNIDRPIWRDFEPSISRLQIALRWRERKLTNKSPSVHSTQLSFGQSRIEGGSR
jgi:hypothetical protein